MERPTNILKPMQVREDTSARNIYPHILRNKEYDLEWLLWARQQKYLEKLTLLAIENRITELQNSIQ